MGMDPSLIQRAEDAVGDLKETIDEALSDGVIDVDEALKIRKGAILAQRRVHSANGAQRAAISMLRTGRVNPYVMSQFGSIDDDDPDDDGAPRLKVA